MGNLKVKLHGVNSTRKDGVWYKLAMIEDEGSIIKGGHAKVLIKSEDLFEALQKKLGQSPTTILVKMDIEVIQ